MLRTFNTTLAFLFVLVIAASFSAQAAVMDGDDVVVNSTGQFKDFSVSFFSIASVKNMRPGKTADDRSISSYDYFSFNYKMDYDQRLSLRLPFYFNTDGKNEYGDTMSSELAMADIHLVYSNYDLGYIGDVDLSGKVKLYLPTSRRSANSRQITQIRLEGYADYSITRSLVIAYVAKPDFYWQTQTVSINDTIGQYSDGTYIRDPRSTTQQYGLEHYLLLQWIINDTFRTSLKTGFDEGWYHSSAAEALDGTHSTKLRLGADLWIFPKRGLSFTLGVSNETTVGYARNNDNIRFVEPENTQYSLMTNWAMF